MDSMSIEKIHALRKQKQQKHSRRQVFYPLTALTCGLLFTSPFWFPCLYSSTKILFCVSIPKVLSLFFNAKSLFILGNLIVIFLVRDSKVRPSNHSHNSDNHPVRTLPNKATGSAAVKIYSVFFWKNRKTVSERLSERPPEDLSLKVKAGYVEKMGRGGSLSREEGRENGGVETAQAGEEGGENFEDSIEELMIPALSTDELRRRADDFIARFNKQIRLEANEVVVY